MTRKLLSIAATLVASLSLLVSTAAASPWTDGRPTLLAPGASMGYYFWSDAAGVHLVTTGPGPEHVFTGQLTSPGALTNVQLMRPEADDSATDQGGHVLRFHFDTYNGLDGLTFQLAGSGELTLDLAVDGHPIAPAHIYVGAGNGHPAASTFTVYHLP